MQNTYKKATPNCLLCGLDVFGPRKGPHWSRVMYGLFLPNSKKKARDHKKAETKIKATLRGSHRNPGPALVAPPPAAQLASRQKLQQHSVAFCSGLSVL